MNFDFHTVLKSLVVLFVAGILMSCNKKCIEPSVNAITFKTENAWTTKATAAIIDEFTVGNQLAIYSYNHSDIAAPQLFMDKVWLTKEESGWTYSPLRYWPEGFGNKLSFFACYPMKEAPGDNDLQISTTDGEILLEYTRPSNESAEIDIMVSNVPAIEKTENGKVSLPISHLLTNLRFSLTDKTYSSGMYGNRARVKSFKLTCTSNSKAEVTFSTEPNASSEGVFNYEAGAPSVITDLTIENSYSYDSLADAVGDVEIFKNENILLIPGDITSISVKIELDIYSSFTVGIGSLGDLEVEDGIADSSESETEDYSETVSWATTPSKTVTLEHTFEESIVAKPNSIINFNFTYVYGDDDLSAGDITQSAYTFTAEPYQKDDYSSLWDYTD